jgi:hypothetical protein
MDIQYYGFSDAITNSIVWISQFFSSETWMKTTLPSDGGNN